MTGNFLGLPGELRNRIYRLALLSDVAIPVTAQHFQEPALLHACKLILREAIKMLEKEDKLRDDHEITLKWFICPVVPRNWSNVLKWLEQAHHGSVLGWSPGHETRRATEFAIIGEMFATCEDMKDLPWKRVAGVIERFHKFLVGVCGSWAAMQGEGGT